MKSKFETMSALMRATKRTSPDTWDIMVEEKRIAQIGIDRNAGGYLVFLAGAEIYPTEHRNFMKALASLITVYQQAEIMAATRADYVAYLANIRPRLEYFKANPGRDPFIICLTTGDNGKGKVNYALTSDGVSDLSWCDIHLEKMPKTIRMFATFDAVQSALIETKKKHNLPIIAEAQIVAKRFSEALSDTAEFFGWGIMDFNRKLLTIGKYQ